VFTASPSKIRTMLQPPAPVSGRGGLFSSAGTLFTATGEEPLRLAGHGRDDDKRQNRHTKDRGTLVRRQELIAIHRSNLA
jgi:hypothetical protein